MFKIIFCLLFFLPLISNAQKTIGEVVIQDETSKEAIEIVAVKTYDLSEKDNVALISKPGSKYDAILIYLKNDDRNEYDLTLAAMLNSGLYFEIKIETKNLNLTTQSFHTILEVNAKDVWLKLLPQKTYLPLNNYICPIKKRRALWLFGKSEYRPTECI